MAKKIIIIKPNDALIQTAHEMGVHDTDFVIFEKPTIEEIKDYLNHHNSIKNILAPSIPSISDNFIEMDDFVSFCMLRHINIHVNQPRKMSLYMPNGALSADFKSRLTIDTEFNGFDFSKV